MADTETETTATDANSITHKEALTEYVILSRQEAERVDAIGWLEVARISARGAIEAIRKNGVEGTFVAVPVRSWNPIEVASKQTTTLDLKPAT